MIDDASDIIDVHFLYMHKIQIYYKTRGLDSESFTTAIDACNAQIAIAPKVAKIFRSEERMPSHTGFSQLAIILEKEKRYALPPINFS